MLRYKSIFSIFVAWILAKKIEKNEQAILKTSDLQISLGKLSYWL